MADCGHTRIIESSYVLCENSILMKLFLAKTYTRTSEYIRVREASVKLFNRVIIFGCFMNEFDCFCLRKFMWHVNFFTCCIRIAMKGMNRPKLIEDTLEFR